MIARAPRIFIGATEQSGDNIAADLMGRLKHQKVPVTWIGVGGIEMEKEGLKSLCPISDFAVMGLVEVLKRVFTLKRRLNQIVTFIQEENPELVISVDSPSLWRRVAMRVKKTHPDLRWIHVVAPQVWGRKQPYAEAGKYKVFDRILGFFKFEKKYFTHHKIPFESFGHPVVDCGIRKARASTFFSQYPHLRGDKIYALIPGSRQFEVETILPVMIEVGQHIMQIEKRAHFILPVVPTVEKWVRQKMKESGLPVTLIGPRLERYAAFQATHLAICKSGTVTSELALAHVPTVVVYKLNALTYFLATMKLSFKYVTLINILAKRFIFPECLQSKMTTKTVLKAVDFVEKNHSKISTELKRVRLLLSDGVGDPLEKLSTLVRREIKDLG